MAARTDTTAHEGWRPNFGRLITISFLLLASAWVALVNGQPVFMASDSTNYVRSVDFAVVYFLGEKYATAWTQDRTIRGIERASHKPVKNDSNATAIPLNAPFDKAVLSGRSIYYGALLYLGQVSGHFWLSVFIQGAIFLYLSYTLAITCLGLSFPAFASVTTGILLLTPVSFFVSFLMPDIFASYLVLATIALTVFWDRLSKRKLVAVSAIILYSVLTHISHLLLLIFLTFIFGLVSIIDRRKTIFSAAFPKQAAILGTLIAFGILGELAFSYGVKLATGAYPLRPPFVMARLIEDGPGFRYLQKNCATKPYVICNYLQKLPTGVNTFLWSKDPKLGIFDVVNLATRKALTAEQPSFVWDVFRFDPIGVVADAAKNFMREIGRVGLPEFFFTEAKAKNFKHALPESYYAGLRHTHLVFHDWILTLGMAYAAIYNVSAAILVLCLAFWQHIRSRSKLSALEKQRWPYILALTITALICNAAICGSLSGPFSRYQTRIAWLPLFVICLLAASLWPELLPKKLRYRKVAASRDMTTRTAM